MIQITTLVMSDWEDAYTFEVQEQILHGIMDISRVFTFILVKGLREYEL